MQWDKWTWTNISLEVKDWKLRLMLPWHKVRQPYIKYIIFLFYLADCDTFWMHGKSALHILISLEHWEREGNLLRMRDGKHGQLFLYPRRRRHFSCCRFWVWWDIWYLEAAMSKHPITELRQQCTNQLWHSPELVDRLQAEHKWHLSNYCYL